LSVERAMTEIVSKVEYTIDGGECREEPTVCSSDGLSFASSVDDENDVQRLSQ